MFRYEQLNRNVVIIYVYLEEKVKGPEKQHHKKMRKKGDD